jgi:hypothetical protein
MKVSEDSLLRRIAGPKRNEVTEGLKKLCRGIQENLSTVQNTRNFPRTFDLEEFYKRELMLLATRMMS